MFRILGSIIFVLVVVGSYFAVNGVDTGPKTTTNRPAYKSPDNDSLKNLKF